ncbi:hypothetical protein ACHMW7_18150 [Aminobacter sp. UC22_36]|uniref:hypothetical protein n=1 Tax=Aminobacter sp. UC22_36 TaxID=3374549 RepID=UPI003756E095
MSLFSRLFRSKAQKAVDGLQDDLNRRLLAVQAGLELFQRTTKAFDMSGIDDGSSEAASFNAAQGRHAFFTSALIDDLGHVEELIKAMRRALEYNNGRPNAGFEREVMQVEKDLARTNTNIERLGKVCRQLVDIAGDIDPDREEDHANLKQLIDYATVRKCELKDTLSQIAELLDDMIAQIDAGTVVNDELASKAFAVMKAGTALSLANDEWIDFLEAAIRAPSLDPFRAEMSRKRDWMEERFRVYENASVALEALTKDNSSTA